MNGNCFSPNFHWSNRIIYKMHTELDMTNVDGKRGVKCKVLWKTKLPKMTH